MPRDSERMPTLLDLIAKEWSKNPDLRFFQLVSNIQTMMGIAHDPYFVEDDQVIDFLSTLD